MPGLPVPDWHADMKEAIEQLAIKPTSSALGAVLRFYRRRVFNNHYIDTTVASRKKHTGRWKVFAAADFRERSAQPHRRHGE
jgi:hypothetical protein